MINKDIEKRRLIYVYKTLIDTPEAREGGIGDINPARMTAAIDTIARILRIAAQARGRRGVLARLPAGKSGSHAANIVAITLN